jgi:hypothetical protein
MPMYVDLRVLGQERKKHQTLRSLPSPANIRRGGKTQQVVVSPFSLLWHQPRRSVLIGAQEVNKQRMSKQELLKPPCWVESEGSR